MPKQAQTRTLADESKRAERRERERVLMAEAVEALRCSAGWQHWLRVRASFHSYSFYNQLLIAFQKPQASRVAGFRAWLALGYRVRKGEKAIWIWAPCKPSKKRLEQWEREGADPDQRPKTFFRMVPVFDRSQVDPLPDHPGGPAQLDPPVEPLGGDGLARFLDPLRDFAESLGYSFSIEETPRGVDGYCDSRKKHVAVRPVGPRFSPNAQVSTAAHEGAHALLESSRQDDDPKLTYAEEELVVECVAFSVCSAIGLDTSKNSIPYIAHWGQAEEIDRYAALIDRLASRIEDALLGEPPQPEASSARLRAASHPGADLAAAGKPPGVTPAPQLARAA